MGSCFNRESAVSILTRAIIFYNRIGYNSNLPVVMGDPVSKFFDNKILFRVDKIVELPMEDFSKKKKKNRKIKVSLLFSLFQKSEHVKMQTLKIFSPF